MDITRLGHSLDDDYPAVNWNRHAPIADLWLEVDDRHKAGEPVGDLLGRIAYRLCTTRRNALINSLPEPKTLQLDWRFPPDGVQFPILLAADLIYEERNVAPLIRLISRMLAPVGVCLLTDQDRVPSSLLRRRLADAGLPFTTTMLRAGEPGTRFKGTLYRITQPGGTDPLDSSPAPPRSSRPE